MNEWTQTWAVGEKEWNDKWSEKTTKKEKEENRMHERNKKFRFKVL